MRRLPGYDYSAQGGYFVTMVLEPRYGALGRIVGGRMMLSDEGEIVEKEWKDIPTRYQGVLIDEFCVMPDHFHGILIFTKDHQRPPRRPRRPRPLLDRPIHGSGGQADAGEAVTKTEAWMTWLERRRMLLSLIVGRFKQQSAKKINLLRGTPGRTVWGRDYWERIIRDTGELDRTRAYIRNNPKKSHTQVTSPSRTKV